MNRKLLTGQIMAGGVLSLILLAEWSYAEFSRGRLQAIMDQTVPTDYHSEPLPTLNIPKQNTDSVNAIIERPLFIEGRRPLVETPVETAETSDTGQLDDWLLIGTYTKNKRPTALFRKQNEARKFLKLNQDQLISGWQLKEILSDRVVLQQGAQQKPVMLRKPREQAKSPAPPKKPATPIKPAKPIVPNNNNPSENNNDDG
ncbi:hypothetical protein IVG45_06720 [Methylomonas sp. LL1]|uniref:hypothetical protein n=1 Tax=Methylomonas sp. LL1 TaxID=2785785 RepID=UPI0018C4491B|nr:hypothetical protein [Methylomonas sp. LL1]QPK64641.1 hypothetical protein IVG45_06720 [Methylomonas sp. LL1]